MIKPRDFTHIVKFWDADEIVNYYPEWYEDDSILDSLANQNMSGIIIDGETLPIAFDKEKSLIIVFDVTDKPQELADKAVEILKNCPWDDRPIEDENNCIYVVNGLYNVFQKYAF